MNLQRYEQVSQAEDLTAFRQGLVDFANDLDFGLVVSLLTVEHRGPGAKTEYHVVGNTPEAFLNIQKDNSYARRDPVHQRLMNLTKPLIYDQGFYVEAGAGELWEMYAPFGYRTGVAVGVQMPGYRRLLLGVDREDPLPADPIKLNRMIADLQLLAVHAQDAAARLLIPRKAAAVELPRRQLEDFEVDDGRQECLGRWQHSRHQREHGELPHEATVQDAGCVHQASGRPESHGVGSHLTSFPYKGL